MSDELKTCPFCGGSATIGGLVPWAECAECGASGAAESDDATAAAAWNRRVAPQPPAEAQACGCGEATCTVPWEPGCGLGKSEQHAEAQPVAVFNCPNCPVAVESQWREPDCPECGERCFLDQTAKPAAPPSAPVGVVDDFRKGWEAGRIMQRALAQQPAADGGFTAADMMDARQEGREEAQQLVGFTAGDMTDAAAQGFRDGVASVGAAAAKDAEIEALRAEVAAVWNAMPSGARYLDPPDGGDVPLHEQVRRMAADAARAERLAEALWEARHYIDGNRFPGVVAKIDSLRDHDQEGK